MAVVTEVEMLMDVGSGDKLPWCVQTFKRDGELVFALVEPTGNVRRRVSCPSAEGLPLMEALIGKSYPLNNRLIELIGERPVIDIGSHCGGTAVYWQERLQSSHIHCYEPSPTGCMHLQGNLDDPRGRDDFTVYNAAVGLAAGKSEYFARKNIYVSGLYQNADDAIRHEVDVVSGMEALQRVPGEIGLLKIDTEHSEVPILFSARYELDRVRAIYIEYHSDDDRRLIDQILRDFWVFSNMNGTFGSQQGTLGYLRRDLKDLVC